MSAKMGRPPVENPRKHVISLRLTDEEIEAVEEAREKDKKPERSLSAWASRKFAELAKKLAGKK